MPVKKAIAAMEKLKVDDGDVVLVKIPQMDRIQMALVVSCLKQAADSLERVGRKIQVIVLVDGIELDVIDAKAMEVNGWIRKDTIEPALTISETAVKAAVEAFDRGFPTPDDRKLLWKAAHRLKVLRGE